MEVTSERITPAKAEAWLNRNKTNRKLRTGVAEKYSDDMRAGRWTTCPMPISFYADGDLADGQHRLFAIVDSGLPQTFLVARGLERVDGLNIDTGMNRSIVDNGRISGVDANLSNTLIGVARAVEAGSPSPASSVSNTAKMEIVNRHRECCEWAMKNGPRSKYLRNSLVLAAIARAWCAETDHDKLKRYCDVLQSGFADGTVESAAIAMRNYLLSKGSVSSTTAMWRDTFLKVQNSISYFMRGKSLTVIKTIADEAYPLKKRKRA